MFEIPRYPWGLPVGTNNIQPVDKSVDCVYKGIRGVIHHEHKTVDKNNFGESERLQALVLQAFDPAYKGLTEY